MASIITTVALDPDTADIKNRMIAHYGFSAWVRECLRRFAAEQGEQTHTHDEGSRIRGLCNGMTKPVCMICWSRGPPSRDDWMRWREGELENQPDPAVPFFTLPDQDTEKQGNKAPTKRRPGIIRRFIRWLI